MKKKAHYIFYLLFFTYNCNAQLLYLQENYKGGISVDGKGYYGQNYMQADTINFVNSVPPGSTIKKAFLISYRVLFQINNPKPNDNPFLFIFNNDSLTFDSSNIVTYSRCENSSSPAYLEHIVVKDVTAFTALGGNQLLTPCQGCNITNNFKKNYVYDGFLLVILYENNSMPVTNTVVFLNNKTFNWNMQYNSITGLNIIDNTKDVGLSLWANDLNIEYPINLILNSSIGNYNLGDYWFNESYITHPKDELLAPGSFYYQNNTLFGLQDDSPDAFIDSTDALANIKTYIGNGTTSFSLSTTINQSNSGCNDIINTLILAYSTPCPARAITASQNYTLCSGDSKALSISSSTVNTSVSWYATDSSLSSYTIANPIASPTISTNYIAYVDSAGCKHTEHVSIAVYASPTFDSLRIHDVVCGDPVNSGGVSVLGSKGGTIPYTYNVGGLTQTGNSLGGLVTGNYTVTLIDKSGCTYRQPFTIAQINIAKADFTYAPATICINEPVAFTNKSTNTNLQTWSFNLQDSATQNPVHIFSDTGTYMVTLIAWRNQRPCSDTISKTLVVKECPPDSINLTVPNIFTPNGDGINDVWQTIVYNINYTLNNYACTIYNRWGIKVFETDNINTSWDGKTTSGIAISSGTYYYLIKLTATNSKNISEHKEFKGCLELVR